MSVLAHTVAALGSVDTPAAPPAGTPRRPSACRERRAFRAALVAFVTLPGGGPHEGPGTSVSPDVVRWNAAVGAIPRLHTAAFRLGWREHAGWQARAAARDRLAMASTAYAHALWGRGARRPAVVATLRAAVAAAAGRHPAWPLAALQRDAARWAVAACYAP